MGPRVASAASTPPARKLYVGMKHAKNLKPLENPESIVVTVGSQSAAMTWHLPKALLIHGSQFFAAALSRSFTEATSNSALMPEDDPDLFRLWVQWLFVANITCKSSIVALNAWILGDKLGCVDFQNIAMKLLLEFHSSNQGPSLIGPSTLRAACEGSAPRSKLRKWALDFFIFETRKNQDGSSSAVQRNLSWISKTKDIEDLSQDYVEARVRCSLESELVNPWHEKFKYMEGLTPRHVSVNENLVFRHSLGLYCCQDSEAASSPSDCNSAYRGGTFITEQHPWSLRRPEP